MSIDRKVNEDLYAVIRKERERAANWRLVAIGAIGFIVSIFSWLAVAR